MKQVPEESRLVFRAPASSLECCCFISNDEFLSGSDDGSIELWTVLKKKPVFIVRNAHSSSSSSMNFELKENGAIPNGCMGMSFFKNFIYFSLQSFCKLSLHWRGSLVVISSFNVATNAQINS